MCKAMEEMRKESMHEEKIEIALNMLQDGMKHELIAKYTGLTIEAIEELSKEIPA